MPAFCLALEEGFESIETDPNYTKDGVVVLFPEELLLMIPESKREGLLQCLADDPRPSYQEDETRVYGMKFAEFDVKFSVQDNKLTVVSVTK